MKRLLVSIAVLFAGAGLWAQQITPEHVERLGIPSIRMADGPQGVRNNTRSTLFACGVAAAASWNPGQEGGKALAEIIYGKVNPSGRLPVSFPAALEDNPSQAFYYPPEPYSKRGHSVKPSVYGEGVFVGYRGYGSKKPLYPFGYGLGYTSFSYGPLNVVPAEDGYDVILSVTNTGKRAGAETVQLYVCESNPSVPRPERELKAFRKVQIGKGKTETVCMHLPREAFAYYDTDVHGWKVNPGTFVLEAGASAMDIRSRAKVELQ